MTVEYQEAVLRSKKYFQSAMNGDARGLAAGRNMANARDFDEMHMEVLGAAMLRKRLQDLIAWSKTDAEGFDTLRLGIAASLLYHPNEKLPPEAQEWLGKFLRGKVKRPKAKAGRGHESGINHLIWVMVGMLQQNGMKATRNDVSDPLSACDAVAQALEELELTPTTFHGVKRIWMAMDGSAVPGIEAT
jgi:hypothetical protein